MDLTICGRAHSHALWRNVRIRRQGPFGPSPSDNSSDGFVVILESGRFLDSSIKPEASSLRIDVYNVPGPTSSRLR
jgi:hypothetical protein